MGGSGRRGNACMKEPKVFVRLGSGLRAAGLRVKAIGFRV